jgi:hypothetical protein
MDRYPSGDVAWLATDARGQVAVVTTAGVAPIPVAVLDQWELVAPAEELLGDIPVWGDARMLVVLPRPDDYIEFARRGLYPYDWQDVHRVREKTGGYEMMSCPTRPLSAHELGDPLREIAQPDPATGSL